MAASVLGRPGRICVERAVPAATQPFAMPSQDPVREHDDKGRAPIAPRLDELHPKQSVALAEMRTLDGSSKDRQLLTEGHVLKRDGTV